MLGLDPACPEPDTELQLRAALLLVLTCDIKKGTGVRYGPVMCLQWVNASCVLPYKWSMVVKVLLSLRKAC